MTLPGLPVERGPSVRVEPPRVTAMRRANRASEHVAARILDSFYSDGLKPGEWLGTEATLAERFNVSRVTIRDAVGALSARGLLDVRVGAGGGLRIARGDPDRLIDAFSIQMRLMGLTRDELFEAMLAIEPVTAALAARRATQRDLAALHGLVDEAAQTVDNPSTFTSVAVNFHQAIAEASHNRALRASLAAVRATQLEHLGQETTHAIAERVTRIHAGILEAIVAHDAPLASERMRVHLTAVSHAARV
jgi:GntR family transcriptional regulator, transcriptional repressor for pyruvate dehydrogenase complex